MLECRVVEGGGYDCIDALLLNPLGHVDLKLDLVEQDLVNLLAPVLLEAIHRHSEALAGQNPHQVFHDKLEDSGKVVEEEHQAIDRDGMLMSPLEHVIELSETTESACRGVNSL